MFLPKISLIFTAFSHLFIAMLFCSFVYVPWIQGSQLAIENAVKAQPSSCGACSGWEMRVRSQICRRLTVEPWAGRWISSFPLWTRNRSYESLHGVGAMRVALIGEQWEGSNAIFYTYWWKNTDLILLLWALDVVQQYCRGTLGCRLGELSAYHRTANLTDKYIAPKCAIECIAKRGARLLCSYVTVRITISNSVISFAGETWVFSLVALESHLTSPMVTAVHIS